MSDSRESTDFQSAAGSEDIVRITYDWSSTPPSTGVVEAIADAADRDATTLEPMYETIDPDALDQLVRSESERELDGNVAVSFEYAGYGVTVRGDGSVVVRIDADDPASD